MTTAGNFLNEGISTSYHGDMKHIHLRDGLLLIPTRLDNHTRQSKPGR